MGTVLFIWLATYKFELTMLKHNAQVRIAYTSTYKRDSFNSSEQQYELLN